MNRPCPGDPRRTQASPFARARRTAPSRLSGWAAALAICLTAGAADAEAKTDSSSRALTLACSHAKPSAATVSCRCSKAPASQICAELGFGLGWLLPAGGRERERPIGRRAKHVRAEGENQVDSPPARCWLSAVGRRLSLALVVCLVLAWGGPRPVVAQPPPVPLAGAHGSAGTPEPDADGTAPDSDLASSRRVARPVPSGGPVVPHAPQPAGGFSKSRGTYPGEVFPRAPYWGSPNIVTTDPAEYPRPRSLDNDNPNSFWYTYRPNIFNQPVEAEWDFYNIINTDRPDFTDAVYSVGKGVSISENGFTFEKINDSTTHLSTRQLPESLIRYGLTNEFELRMKWNGYLMSDSKDVATGVHTLRFGGEDLDVGFKYEIWQQRGWRPMCTVVYGMLLPTGTGGQPNQGVQPHFNLLAGWGLRRWAYLKWETGCDFLQVQSQQQLRSISSVPGFVTVNVGQQSWHESISLLTQWTKRVGAFHEWFMISNVGAGDTRAQHFLDMGLYLYATPNVQFDVRVGRRLSNRVNEFFTGAGLSARW